MKTYIFSIAFLLAVVSIGLPASAQAAGLTQSQINAIISVLTSFGADQSVINNVRIVLSGAPTTARTPVTVRQTASALDAFNSALNAGAAQTVGLTYIWNHDLQIGSPYSADIGALQMALAQEQVYTGKVTSGFYNQTFAAVKAFQQKYGIEATGYVGPETRAKLNALYAPH